jgi:hypothetical protein
VQLKEKLEKIHPDLVFEFSTISKQGIREFVISADGIESAFPFVNDLVSSAPQLKNWKVIAFRQPRKNVTQVKYKGLSIDTNDVFFRYAKINGKIDLELHMKSFYESAEWSAGTFLLLDTILGEYYTALRIGAIEKRTLDENEVSDLHPIRCLAQIVESYHSEFNN